MIATSGLIGYLIVVGLITVSSGPDTVLVVGRATAFGTRVARVTALGSASGLLVWGMAAVAGISAILSASAMAFTVLKFAGASYLVYLGLRLLWSSRRLHAAYVVEIPGSGSPGPLASYRQGLLTNLLNPKAGAFFTALLPQFVPPGAHATVTVLAYALIAAVASLVGLFIYAQLAAGARGIFAASATWRALDRATGMVLVGLGLRLAFERD